MSEFFSLLKFEHLKSKRNFSVWLMLLFPWVLSLLNMMYILYDAREHGLGLYMNPWLYMVRYLFQLYALLYPLLTGILAYSLFDMEHRHSNFQRLFVLPVGRKCLLGARLFFVAELVTLSILGAYAAFCTFSFPLSWLLPHYDFCGYDAREMMAAFFVKLYQGVLVLACIHYAFSCLFRRFSVVLCIASIGLMFSVVFSRWEYIVYSPYYYPYQSYYDLMMEDASFMGAGGTAGILYILLSVLILIFVYTMKGKKCGD